MAEELLNIHAVLPRSRVNGPGTRTVIFFQGCARRCPGCFNPDTHTFGPKNLYTPEYIFNEFLYSPVEGITLSGGEPFMQPCGLLSVLRLARDRGLSSVVYTGFTYEELKERGRYSESLKLIDVLIDGGYKEEMKEMTLLARGSTNQRFIFLTGRYRLEDLLMPARAEITIGKDGLVTETGFSRIIQGRF